jgi:hypothetical protein
MHVCVKEHEYIHYTKAGSPMSIAVGASMCLCVCLGGWWGG